MAIFVGTQVYNLQAAALFFTSLVQGGIGGAGVITDSSVITDGGGNLDGDPLFVDAAHGNLRLAAASPAIDTGTNSAITQTTDLGGNQRKIDGNHDGIVVVDIGAFEAPPLHPLTVTLTGSGGGQVVPVPSDVPCNTPFSALYQEGASVTLTATAQTTATFGGWSGDCSGIAPCDLTLDGGKRVTATFTLAGSVQGQVVDEQGNGVAGAEVTLSDSTGEAASATLLTDITGITDSGGNYLFSGVPQGDYTITVHIAGHEPSTPHAVTVQSGQTTTVPDISAQRGQSLLHLPLLDRAQ